MNTYVDKTQENVNIPVTKSRNQLKSGKALSFQFVNDRPETIIQEKHRSLANNNSRTIQLESFQHIANNNFRTKHINQLQVLINRHTAQSIHPIQKKETETGLPENLKSGVENLSGYSMDDVKVRYNSNKPAQLQAHAYAQGTTIHLAPGQEKHLPHEAWHVVQQKQGRVRPTMQMKGNVKINDDLSLEKEADVMGQRAATPTAQKKPSSIKESVLSSEDAITQRQIIFNQGKKVEYLSADDVIARLSRGGQIAIPRDQEKKIRLWDSVDRYFEGGFRQLQQELEGKITPQEPIDLPPRDISPQLIEFLDILRENDRLDKEITWIRDELPDILYFLKKFSPYDLAWLIVVGNISIKDLKRLDPAKTTSILHRFDSSLASGKVFGDYNIVAKDAAIGKEGALGELEFIERHAQHGAGALTAIPELELATNEGNVKTPDFDINGVLTELKTSTSSFNSPDKLLSWIDDHAVTANKQLKYSDNGQGNGKGNLVIQLKAGQIQTLTDDGIRNVQSRLKGKFKSDYSSIISLIVLVDGKQLFEVTHS